MPTLRQALRAQGAYYVATGAAPFVSRRGFEAVTGPKREWWLVQTVGALAGAIGASLLVAAERGAGAAETRVLAAGSAVAFGAVDVVYVARRRIAPTYLLDAVAQAACLGALLAASCPQEDAPSAVRR